MEENSISVEFSEWVITYKPKLNHFDKTAGVDGYLFLSYGEQWDFVCQHDTNKIWTLIVTDLDDGTDWEITSGIHYVNVQGYLVTELVYLDEVNVTY